MKKYLDQDEVDYNRLERNEFKTLSQNISIKIANGNFTWGKDLPKEKKKVDNKEKGKFDHEKLRN